MKYAEYQVTRDNSLDFSGEAYATIYPNLHRYPATMIPQLGIAVLDRFALTGKSMMDPYCGSGSSFAAGVHRGFKTLRGYDLNPLAALISRVKFTRISERECLQANDSLWRTVSKATFSDADLENLPLITNMSYWFSEDTIWNLAVIRQAISSLETRAAIDLATLAFSETIRDASYTRNNEFFLYRIPAEKIKDHRPDVKSIFLTHLRRIMATYVDKYLPTLKNVKIQVSDTAYVPDRHQYDVVLTSPPYGDSRTTVAYGQFSTLTNEWLGLANARKIDGLLMGGKRATEILSNSVITPEITRIETVDQKRALEVSAFYSDLGASISSVAKGIKDGGYSIYIVGNRRVKDVQLSTDQFIAEQFQLAGLTHVATYERAISNKSMPASNSPSNKAGATRGTMTQEFIVICKR